MHPTIGYHLAQAHLAELRHQAHHETLARAARRARPHQGGPPVPTLPALGRRVMAALGARST
jgi:hypothetical protein